MLFGVSIFSQITLTKDISFGTNGVASFTYPSEMLMMNFEKVFINDDNSLNICLGTEGAYHTGMIAQLTSAGVLDTSYNSTGKLILNGNPHTAFEFAKQGQKIIAIYANDYFDDNPDSKLVRYNGNGSVDQTFGVNGSVFTHPNLFYRKLIILPNRFFHVWGKITGYQSNGAVNNAYGNNGVQNPVVNGVPYEYLELYSFFGNRNGKAFFNKNHSDIAVSNQNAPHQFTNYQLSDHGFYTVPNASSGISVYPKKFHITAENQIAYLFGIDPNSGIERNRFVILNEAMQPKIFNMKEYIDLGEVSQGNEIYDLAQFQNQYVFVGKKENKPIIFSLDQQGNRTKINGSDELFEKVSADDFSTVLVKDNAVYVLGKKSASHEIFLIKYNAQFLSASDSSINDLSVQNPFKDEFKILNAKNIQKITFYNAVGSIVKSAKQSTVPTADLTPGIYIVKIDFTNRPSQTVKAIKN